MNDELRRDEDEQRITSWRDVIRCDDVTQGARRLAGGLYGHSADYIFGIYAGTDRSSSVHGMSVNRKKELSSKDKFRKNFQVSVGHNTNPLPNPNPSSVLKPRHGRPLPNSMLKLEILWLILYTCVLI